MTHSKTSANRLRPKLEQSSQGSIKVLANNQHELPVWKSSCCLCQARPAPLAIFALNDNLFKCLLSTLNCTHATRLIWSFHNERYRFAAFIHSLTQWLQGFMIRCIFWSWPLLPPHPEMLPQYWESHSNHLSSFWKCLHPLHKYTLQTRFCRLHCQAQCTEVAEFPNNQLFEV